VPLDKTPRAIDASPDGKRVYFTLAGVSAVQILDTATNQIVAQIAVGVSPHQRRPRLTVAGPSCRPRGRASSTSST